jgi:hypothetical protein
MSGLAVLLILGVSAACGGNLIPVTGNTAGNILTLSECYQVRYLGFSREPEGASIWRYQVEELSCAVQELSDWMLEIPACATVLDAAPALWEVLEPDPILQSNGIKWKMPSDFQGGVFNVKLSGPLIRGAVEVGVIGPAETVGFIQGPVCDPNAPTATATFTSTLTITPTLSPTASMTTTATSTIIFVPNLSSPTSVPESTRPARTSTPVRTNTTAPVLNTATSVPANTSTTAPNNTATPVPTISVPDTSVPADTATSAPADTSAPEPTRTTNRPPTKTPKPK